MTKINYQLADGKTVEIEVPNDVAELTVELETADRRTRWRDHKRAEISVDELGEKGFEIVDETQDVPTIAELNGDIDTLNAALATLPDNQLLLIRQVFFDEVPLQDIAAEQGVTYQAIQNRLKKILKKLKDFCS